MSENERPVHPMRRGWRCVRDHIDGPCAGRPTWWNLIDRWRFRR